jgi:hypothetical protein
MPSTIQGLPKDATHACIRKKGVRCPPIKKTINYLQHLHYPLYLSGMEQNNQRTIFIGILILPIFLFLLEGLPAANEKGTICYETWKAHYRITRFLLAGIGIFGLFFFKNWFFKVFSLVLVFLIIFAIYFAGWSYTDLNC